MPETSSAPETKSQHLNRQRGGYSAELDNWLTTNAALMGERSTHGGLVAAIERGGTGGNKGTKGVGVTRIEPFTQCRCEPPKSCPVCNMATLHKTFDRADRCWMAWRGMTDYERNLLAARYLYSREKLPPGLHGQLGDLSAVAYVVSERLAIPGRLVHDIANGKCRRWEDVCAVALEEAHRSWTEERARADREIAESSEVAQ